jgi:hypothetical protein
MFFFYSNAQVRSQPNRYLKEPGRNAHLTIWERALIFTNVLPPPCVWEVEQDTVGNKLYFMLATPEPFNSDSASLFERLDALTNKYTPIIYSFVLRDSSQYFSRMLYCFFDKKLHCKHAISTKITYAAPSFSIIDQVKNVVPLFFMKGQYFVDTTNHTIEFEMHATDTSSLTLQERTENLALLVYAYIMLDHPLYNSITFNYEKDGEIFKSFEYTRGDMLLRDIRATLRKLLLRHKALYGTYR